ncbi:MAG: hypothetical protein JNL76_08370 [Alphaproteobacteria bacterium]|nr:hypothetical protein [Alphaproteobacteria bacterium]
MNSIIEVADAQDIFPLHRIGWLAFQDLSAAIAEECLKRPVQTFLPTNDGGRDGAFLGTWDGGDSRKTSTIQCKFTSKEDLNLSLSMLKDELEKAKKLVAKGLAEDYIIITNHGVTGTSEALIKKAFEDVGVGSCQVFGKTWIIRQIKNSAKLRMLVPRLYGLGDFSDLLDARSYEQTQIILSEMSDNLEKLVVTKAYKDSVKAISEHGVVLLLGSAAAGKSTIAASLSLGAADLWSCHTIKATSPEHLYSSINPKGGQFFWIDDAWGSTQFQASRTESWNQVFPLMQSVLKLNTKFLITSRDYIWVHAQKNIKIHALPALTKNQVVIKVQDLKIEEKARILYNHLKFGSQPLYFIQAIKPFLSKISSLRSFLPESARRLGNPFFTSKLKLNEKEVIRFFEEPKDFLMDTLQSLEQESLAAIALVFLNGGKIRSPIPMEQIAPVSSVFGVESGKLKIHLESLKDSILLLANDNQGPYWTYKHPTVGDAFASYIAQSSEMVDVYLKGANPDSILDEVVCIGAYIEGAPVVVPEASHHILIERIANLPSSRLKIFVSYRANSEFTKQLVSLRSDIIPQSWSFFRPLSDDLDTLLFSRLHAFGMIDEITRKEFVEEVYKSLRDYADKSGLDDSSIQSVLTPSEKSQLRQLAFDAMKDFRKYVREAESNWESEYDPDDHFSVLRETLDVFVSSLNEDGSVNREEVHKLERQASSFIDDAVSDLSNSYSPPAPHDTTTPQELSVADSIDDLFRDIDE